MSSPSFFALVSVVTTDFDDCSYSWNFISQGIMMLNTSATGIVIQYSFDGGTTVHGELSPDDSSSGVVFDNRHECAIKFRLKTASSPGTARIEAWGN